MLASVFDRSCSVWGPETGLKIDPKSTKNRSWRLKFDVGGQKLAKIAFFKAKKPNLEAKEAVLEAKRPILEAKMAVPYFLCCLWG